MTTRIFTPNAILYISTILKKVSKQKHMWETFQRLPIGKICCIDKDMGGFVKIDQFIQFTPPS
jgi:hypothetical protein